MFKNKVLLITEELVRLEMQYFKNLLILILMKLEFFLEMRRNRMICADYIKIKKSNFIGDVREKQSIDQAIVGVDFVFHAAALKQVPSCEFYPMEAVRTNIIGTENLLTLQLIIMLKK